MNAATITESAQRNREARAAMLARLSPMRGEAKAKIALLRAAQSGATSAQQSLDLMRSLKHVPNFFPTPKAVIAEMLDAAELDSSHALLEPSAGKGDLVAAVLPLVASVLAYEINFTLAEHCRAKGYDCECRDFLALDPQPLYDRVCMNPPFERGIDEKHIRHAVQFLRPGGRLVSVCTVSTASRLRGWECVDLPADAFKTSERPTGVRTALVIANR